MADVKEIEKELGDVNPDDSPEIADAKKQAAAAKKEKTNDENVQELIKSKKYFLPIK